MNRIITYLLGWIKGSKDHVQNVTAIQSKEKFSHHSGVPIPAQKTKQNTAVPLMLLFPGLAV